MILTQIESLPTLPAMAVRLLELTSDTSSSLREVVELLSSDQSLAARVLSMARRAELGTTAETIDRAVIVLGFDAVRSLVLSVQVFETFSHRVERSGGRFDRLGFWKHSLAVGCAARLLAEAAKRQWTGVKPEEAFVCGLLHDLGKVVLDACFPKSYDRVVSAVEVSRGSILDLEAKVFGLDHTIAGQRLATHWKLPENIRETIWLHHHTPASTPTRIGHRPIVQIVQIADRLVREMRIGYSGNHAVDGSSAQLAREAGLAEHALKEAATALPALIEQRAELIGLERLTSREVYQEALAEANAELTRMNSALAEANRRLEHRSRAFDAICRLNGACGDDPTHEEVCRAAVRAGAVLVPGGRMSVVALSPCRGLCTISWSQPDHPGGLEVLPAPAAEAIGSVAEVGTGWISASLLPPGVRDTLASVTGEPPAWCWPIRFRQRLCGMFLAAGDPRLEPAESMQGLSEAVGGWLSAAESRADSRRLNEELAEMNRLLVGTQAQVARMRSLAMVGEMAAGAAHELNNPLAVISGRAQLLAREAQTDDSRRGASLIAEHAHRASAIVSELMDFAKPSPPNPSAWSMAEMLGRIRSEWLEKDALRGGDIELTISDDMPSVLADASQTRMLFDEIIRNALEAMRETASPRIIVNCDPDLADDRVVVRIRDNGCGMTPDVLERATDPFFSHRPAGRGRGLGLSRAARYAEINGGRIRLSSVPGEGTTVVVDLPAAPQ